MKKNIVVLVLVCLVASAVVGTVSAKTGIGLSSPGITSITIDKFPFHYSDTLRVYNTGDEESVYSCLLYTSPSPRDLSTSRMPSSA